jgi:hypothetical protein
MKRKTFIFAVAVVVNAALVYFSALPHFRADAENRAVFTRSATIKTPLKFAMLPKSLESCTCDSNLLLAEMERSDAGGQWHVLRQTDITVYGLVVLGVFNLALLGWALRRHEP